MKLPSIKLSHFQNELEYPGPGRELWENNTMAVDKQPSNRLKGTVQKGGQSKCIVCFCTYHPQQAASAESSEVREH